MTGIGDMLAGNGIHRLAAWASHDGTTNRGFMKAWKLALALIGAAIVGGGLVFLWFMFQLMESILN